MKQLLVIVKDEQLFKQFKILCVQKGKSMGSVVTELIASYIKNNKEN